VQLAVVFITCNEKPATLNFLRDITLQRKMEAIGTLAGRIAHNFKNILRIIVRNAELAMDDMPERHTAQDNLQEIRKACL
jgi:hypothetical protein